MPDVDELATLARKRIGQVLREKWQLDSLLGVGGMAAVYSATHRNGNKAAIKLLHPNIRVGSEAMSRFLREGRVANQVHHPGAVAVLDDDVDEDGSIFVVMELLEGETLGQLVDRTLTSGGSVPVEDLLRIVDEVLDVLATAHENGVVHRDLKPDNVFVLKDGSAKILDFGIARLREAAGGSGHTTAEGMLMGTPEYMPPEQARGDWAHVDGKSDLWAVGATMFYVLAHRPVHMAKTMSAQLVLAGTSNAPPLASVSEGVPDDVCALVDRALAFDRDARWADARSMQERVRALRAAPPVRQRPVASPMSARARLEDTPSLIDEQPRKKSKAAMLVLAAGVIAFCVFAWRSPQMKRLRGVEPPAATESEAIVVPPPASAASVASVASPQVEEKPTVLMGPDAATGVTSAIVKKRPRSQATSPTPASSAPVWAPPSSPIPITTATQPTSGASATEHPPAVPDELFDERK
jgi:serine/threonine-protein kinase